jgi:thiamine-monophosphate kinase
VFDAARRRLERPEPRVALGLALRGVASAAIDVSDGLAGDLGHVLRRSGVGADLDLSCAPRLLAALGQGLTLPAERVEELVFAGGDDYELAFTAPPQRRAAVEQAAAQAGTPVTRIGGVTGGDGLRLRDPQGREAVRRFASFDHFRA